MNGSEPGWDTGVEEHRVDGVESAAGVTFIPPPDVYQSSEMRRDDVAVAVDVDGGDTDGLPALRIRVEGTEDSLPRALRELGAGRLTGDDVDVALRRGDGEEAVLSIARRLTGEFLLEANVPAADIAALVDAATARSDGTRYVVVIEGEGLERRSFENQTLLVYDTDGNLERDASLIPSGVEL